MSTTMERRHREGAQGTILVAERITVALTGRAAHQLQKLREWTGGLSKTDLVNRALSVYYFVAQQGEEGKQLAVYDPQKDEFQLVHVV